MKRLLPSIYMLLIIVYMLTASTYAWYSMNRNVSVTGMSVRAQAPATILIAGAQGGAYGSFVDLMPSLGSYTNQYVGHLGAQLEPVSSTDGEKFFYADTSKVQQTGTTYAKEYTLYDASNTTDFNAKYDSANAVGYVDYVLAVKVINTDEEYQKYVNLDQLDLTYGENKAGYVAFRTAVFVQDAGSEGTDAGEAKLLAILRDEEAEYFSGRAVSGAQTLSSVKKLDAPAVIGIVPANSTHYFKITVRLWLEGEDTSCSNDTFVRFNDKWALDLAFGLEDRNDTAVKYVNMKVTAQKKEIDLNTTSSETYMVGDVTYYDVTGSVRNGEAGVKYYSLDSTVKADSRFFTIDKNEVFEVTNQFKVTPPEEGT